MSAAALVMARAPIPGRCKTRLEPLLGPDGCARLQAWLVAHTATWAAAAAPGAAFVAFDPPDAHELMAPLMPDGVELFAQDGEHLGARIAAAAARVSAARPGPLLVVGTDLPTLRAAHAEAALDDLAHGCDVSLGPAVDGGYYMIALANPGPELFGLPAEVWGGPEVLPRTLALAAERGLEGGLLRGERDLDEPADARAYAIDPLTPPELAALLTP